jgi:hypothetical protein
MPVERSYTCDTPFSFRFADIGYSVSATALRASSRSRKMRMWLILPSTSIPQGSADARTVARRGVPNWPEGMIHPTDRTGWVAERGITG